MEFKELIIWTCTFVFILTALITLLGIIEEPKILRVKDQWLKPLYVALILEIIGVGVFVFKEYIKNGNSEFVSMEVSIPKEISNMKNIDRTKDFFRMFFLKSDKKFSSKLGNPDAERVFMVPSVNFNSPMSLGIVANYLGNDYRKTEDVYLLNCHPDDQRVLDPRLATWTNVFDLIVQDFPVSNCDDPSSISEKASCIAKRHSSTSISLVATDSISEMYKGASELYQNGAGEFLKAEYGISKNSFIGTGHTVSGSGAGKKYRAGELFEKANLPEYVVKNVSIEDGACKCIIVTPYSKRQKQKFDVSLFKSIGEIGKCITLNEFPN